MPDLPSSVVCPARNLRPLSSLLPAVAGVAASPPCLIRPDSSLRPIHTSTLQYSIPSLESQNTTAQSSVSPTETSHFSRLASTWWDPHGPSRLLHLMNPLRHTFIASCLSSRTRPPDRDELRYLDIGCGGGIFAESAARLPHTHAVTGIDPTPSIIQIARSHQRTDPALRPPKLTYLSTAIEDLPVPATEDEKADILTLFEVLEHIDHPAAFLQSCVRHLKKGGWIIGSTIARSALSYLTTKVIAEAPLVGLVPRGTHDWEKYINPEELRGWFEKRSEQARSDEVMEEKKEKGGKWGSLSSKGVIYVPGFGWRMVNGAEGFGNYFFGVQKLDV